MQGQSFAWGRSKNQLRFRSKWIDRLWIILLLLAALLLFSINLGGLPLRDWDEGTVAQVAREIWRAPSGNLHWLYPTLGGQPYYNKPPLMHLLIAWAYSLFGVNEWTTRLPGAMLTAISVPLLYCIAREIFPQRRAAIYSALVYLTMLPIVRHGRLAMLDGAVVCFFLLMVFCLLRSRRDLRYCLGVGIGFALICLTKGILGLLLGAIAVVFLVWDTPRLLSSRYMWLGVLIGSAPVAFWYGAQWVNYGNTFTDVGMVNQSLSRIWQPVEGNSGPPWYYLLEILKYTWPWLIFLPPSWRLIWENRNLSWAKLVLVWSSVYFVAITLMNTKLPWYVIPIYPSIALACGVQLAAVGNMPPKPSYPRMWIASLALLAVVAAAGSIYFMWAVNSEKDLQLVFAAVASTMGLAAVLASQGDRQFLQILFWGSYLSLVLFMNSNNWVWELAEHYPVKPVAAMIQNSGTPQGEKIYTSFAYGRPSLDFYSDRTIIPAAIEELQQRWQQDPHPYLLLDESAFKQLDPKSYQPLGATAGWKLITKP
jgi:4-amino-4-deoxy-L-arabinose transferase-like glycosyltransferase